MFHTTPVIIIIVIMYCHRLREMDSREGHFQLVEEQVSHTFFHANITDPIIGIYNHDIAELIVSVMAMDASDSGLAQGQTATIALSSDIINHLPAGETVRVAFTFYREANLFPVRNSTRENGRTVVGSSVLSAQVNGIADGTELDSPVQLFFVLNNASIPGPSEVAIRRCAFWDFTAAGA